MNTLLISLQVQLSQISTSNADNAIQIKEQLQNAEMSLNQA